MSPTDPGVAVLGAGAWGTALGIQLARNGVHVKLWGHRKEPLAAMATERVNRRYLPGIHFPQTLTPDSHLETAIRKADFILIVVPSTGFAEIIARLPDSATPVFWATKGLDCETGNPLHERAREILGEARGIGVVSGPSFAVEVARGLPTAITVAANSAALARRFANLLHSDHFRPYISTDLTGVELGGAAKNVIAIGAGIADGLGFGANARAGLITRGLAEIRRLGRVLGARPATLMGLAGLGDLVLTCTDNQSRNRRFGLELGGGAAVELARKRIGGAVEGIPAAAALTRLAREKNIEMPISEAVQTVLSGNRTPRDAVATLMRRSMKAER